MYFSEDDFNIHSGQLKSAEWLLDASNVMLQGAFSAPAPGEPMTMVKGPKNPSLDPVNDPAARLNNQHYTYEDMVNNVVSHYHGADENQKKQGRLWYKAAHDFFHKVAADQGVSPAKAVAIGSAFSPQTDWDDNMRHAGHFMMNYRHNDPGHNEHDWQVSHIHPQALAAFRAENGRDPSTSNEDLNHLADLHGGIGSFKKGHDLADPALREQWIGSIQHHGMDKIMADHAAQVAANKKKGYNPTEIMRDILAPGAGGTLGKNVTRAKQIMRAGDDDPHEYNRILGGPKTQYFMSNILDDTPISEDGYYEHPNGDWTQHADLGGTIDSHHLRASGMAHGDWIRKGYDEGASGLSPSNPQTYDVFNRGLLEATRRINAAEPDPRKHLTPKQVQAVVWLKHKADNDRYKPMGINRESELAQAHTAAMDPESFHDMPPLWRKAFMSRTMPEWTDMLSAWVAHHAPTRPEGVPEAQSHQASTYYHRSTTPIGDRPGHAYPHSYFYTADDPHGVGYETRGYGDHVYSAELPDDVMEADPSQPRKPAANEKWYRTDPANVGTLTHIHDPGQPFGKPRTAASWYITADEESAGGSVGPGGKKKDEEGSPTGMPSSSPATPAGVNNFDPSKVTAQPVMTQAPKGMLHYPTVPNVADGRLSDGAYGFAGASGGGSFGSGGAGAAPVNFNPSGGSSQWHQNVLTGLERNGLPASLAPQVERQIQTESSGNPNAINRTDSNAQAGHPSQGLLQTIPSTFQQYHLPGDSNSITDPQANIDSAIGYAKSRYGPSLMDSSGNGMGSGHGY